MSQPFFTSDLHAWHRSRAEFRGFSTMEAMNEAIIADWNRVVRPVDEVYLLGDVCFAGTTKTLDFLDQLNGRIHLVRGNHDKGMSGQVLQRFESVDKMMSIKVPVARGDGINTVYRIELCHFPMLSWDLAHYGAWHLHGHSHGNCKYPHENARMMDVGIDTQTPYVPLRGEAPNWQGRFRPYSFQEVRDIMLARENWSPDHRVRSEDESREFLREAV
jgi:calcineurin-like phosphoesterase family protein